MDRSLYRKLYCLAVAAACLLGQACDGSAERKEPIKEEYMDAVLPGADTGHVTMDEEKTNCLAYTNGRDTVLMTLSLKNETASGKLTYKLFEKDKNEGTFNGKLQSDTLLVYYTFMSEGTRSVRQLAFLKKGDMLQEGTGNMKETNGRMIFTDKKDIDYNSLILLEPVDCDSLKQMQQN